MRFYSYIAPKKKVETIDDHCVIGKVIKVDDETGIRVELVEYNNIPGLILTTQITKYRTNLHKLFPIGKNIPLVVYSMDGDNINLSYRNLNDEKRKYYEECFKTRMRIYNLYEDVNKILKTHNLENEINQCMYHYMDNIKTQNLEKLYQYLLEDPSRLLKINFEDFEETTYLDSGNLPNFDENIIQELVANMTTRIRSSNLIMSLDFKLWVFGENSLNNLKEIISHTDTNYNYSINYIASPNYNLIINFGKDNKLIDDKIQSIKNNLIEKTTNYKKVKFEFLDPKILENINYSYNYLPKEEYLVKQEQ